MMRTVPSSSISPRACPTRPVGSIPRACSGECAGESTGRRVFNDYPGRDLPSAAGIRGQTCRPAAPPAARQPMPPVRWSADNRDGVTWSVSRLVAVCLGGGIEAAAAASPHPASERSAGHARSFDQIWLQTLPGNMVKTPSSGVRLWGSASSPPRRGSHPCCAAAAVPLQVRLAKPSGSAAARVPTAEERRMTCRVHGPGWTAILDRHFRGTGCDNFGTIGPPAACWLRRSCS